MRTLKVMVVMFGVMILFVIYAASKIDFEATQQRAAQADANRKARPGHLKDLTRKTVREACTRNEDWDFYLCQQIDAKQVAIGMNEEQVHLALGWPKDVNSTITSSGNSEQWVYERDYVYVEGGKVIAIQTSH